MQEFKDIKCKINPKADGVRVMGLRLLSNLSKGILQELREGPPAALALGRGGLWAEQ